MSAEWICAYRSPGRDTEVWELRHRSGALLAEMNVYRSTETRWWVSMVRTVRWPDEFSASIETRHRRMLRARRATIHWMLRYFESMEFPPSITDTELTVVEENAETIRRDGSVRSRRRAKLSAKIAQVQRAAFERGVLLPLGEVLR